MDFVGIIGLAIAIGLFADLGTWSMSHEPIHIWLFSFIIILEFLLIYSGIIVVALYIILRDQWLMGLVGPYSNQQAGLTHGGQRISVQ